MNQSDFENSFERLNNEDFTETLEDMLIDEEYEDSYEAHFWVLLSESEVLRHAASAKSEVAVRAATSVRGSIVNKSNI